MRALLTGGASCGKSAVAEELCMGLGGSLVYLAAMRPFGEEGAARVRKHRAQRAGKGFQTVECYEDFKLVLEDDRIDGATVLLECLGNVVANELFSAEGDAADVRDAQALAARIASLLDALSERCAHLIVVGNEVGDDGVEYPAETACYQDVLGIVSRMWANHCNFVSECVAGVPTVVKLALQDEREKTVIEGIEQAS